MNKPPKDITEVAERVYSKLGRGANQDVETIEAALAAERERCAKPVEDAIHEYWHGEPHDLTAGNLTKILNAIRGASK